MNNSTFDFDKIILGHGSGGELTNKLLSQGVFRILDNPYLSSHHDGAFLQLEGKQAFTTDSFVVSPIRFPGGNIGDLAINGTVNDLAMCGATPQFLSLSFILEEGLPVSTLEEIIQSVNAACQKAGVLVVTGDTKVVERGKGDQIFINTTGIGTVHPKAEINIARIQPGDQVIISGEMANHGIAILSRREGLEFETTILSDTRPLNAPVKKLLDKFGTDIRFLRDPTRGGVATVLNEMAQQANLGIEIRESALPVNAATSGACEMLGLDPLFVANEGIFIAIVPPGIADDCLQLLRQDDATQQATIAGEIVAGHPQQVLELTEIGGKRVVPMLAGEQLPRIC